MHWALYHGCRDVISTWATWYTQNLYYKLNFSKSCCPVVKQENKKSFNDWYLIQHSHYLWMVDVMLPLHNFVFGVIC